MKKNNQANERTKIKQIQQEIDETKKIMLQNIDKVIVRGRKIETLRDRSKEMQEKSQRFVKQAKHLKNKEKFYNLALEIVIVGAGVGAAYGVFAGYGWPLILTMAFLGGSAGYAVAWIWSGIQQKISSIFSYGKYIFSQGEVPTSFDASMNKPPLLKDKEALLSQYQNTANEVLSHYAAKEEPRLNNDKSKPRW
ncbi:MAG: hypothetical protein BGO43_06340 [Gammaproteobacteria bacterium 39-13]|nr:hypothetical protein [Gammaproteobacteria bacterium]OJV90465.1 MAG: hypothetical protein BGO43_06340 [Gammaproteobacteria bacterium 39-13]